MTLFTPFRGPLWHSWLSLPDVVNLNHSATNVFGMLRFYFSGLFVVNRIADYKSYLWLATGIGLVFSCINYICVNDE